MRTAGVLLLVVGVAGLCFLVAHQLHPARSYSSADAGGDGDFE
jgi:hypothetical protein